MKTYHTITIGCQMNKSDSERIAGYLEENGLKQSAKRDWADLVIVNTCGVRQSAEDRVYGLIPKIKKENKKAKIVLAGCLSARKDVQRRLKKMVDVWLPITELSGFKTSPLAPLLNRRGELKGRGSCDYLGIKPKYSSKITAFVPIGNGCNNFCAYCVVPYARGREKYRPAEDIIEEVKGLVKKGYKEIFLIAQNVNSYRSKLAKAIDTGLPRPPASRGPRNDSEEINFAMLLKLVNDIGGEFWIRFATSHPKDMSDELIKAIAESDKVCEHLHLPVQAGDNEVLKRMNRNYTVEHYKSLIKKTRHNLTPSPSPSQERGERGWLLPVAITTDIIVGFPGETKKQFKNTVKLFKEIKFDMAYIAQYSPRPGTAAEKFKDDVPKEEKKRREEELMKILRRTALENNKKYTGKVVEILIEGINKRGKLYGKTRTGKVVKVLNMKTLEHKNMKTSLLGEFVWIKINKVQDFGLAGELVK